MEGLVINFVNAYAQTSGLEWLRFFQQMSAFLSSLDPCECLVLGRDFNTTLEEQDCRGCPQGDCRPSLPGGRLARPPPGRLLNVHLCPGGGPLSCHSRLDRIYLSHFHLSWAHSSSIRPAPFLNHHLATMTASLCAERPGPAYWHFNNSLLEDVGFVASFWEFWLAWREQKHAFSLARWWWNVGKVHAQLFCHDYAWGASRRRDAAIGHLELEVLELERRLATSPKDPSLCRACREKRKELWALEDHQARGAFV
ncbi:unnamed protein product [Caretta caretta]